MSSYAISIIVGALATGKEDVQIMCSPEASFMDLGDTFRWYFTRTTIDEGIQLRGNGKYSMSGSASQILTARNISLSDEGFYYCKTARNGVLVSEIMPGACVFTYGKLIIDIFCVCVYACIKSPTVDRDIFVGKIFRL